MISQKNRFPWLYLLLAYALAWIIWIPVALTGRDYQSSPLLVFLLLLGTFGPGLAAIILTYREGGREGSREFWQRVFDFRRIRPVWVWVILLFFPGLSLVVLTIYFFYSGSLPGFDMFKQMILQPVGFLTIPILYLVQAAVEELGWRGYMLDRLQAIWKPLVSALIIGIFHALWHLPLFWVVGTVQITLGFDLDFWIFIGTGLAWSIYATWCYNHNRRSTLAVILLHAAYNLSLALFSEPGAERRILFLIVIFVASVVATVWALHLKPYSREIGQEVVSRSGGIYL